MRTALLAVGVLILTSLTGCFLSRPCTLIGAESGVYFGLGDAVDTSESAYTVRACVDDACIVSSGTGEQAPFLTLMLPDVDSVRTVTAHLTITRANGSTIFDASTAVLLKKAQPNGANCPPAVYQGTVTATSAGTLEVR